MSNCQTRKRLLPKCPLIVEFSLVTLLIITIYAIHISGYWIAYLSQDKTSPEYGSFTLLTAKGDQGFTLDLMRFAIFIRGSSYETALFQHDPLVLENQDKHLPISSLIFFLSSFPLFFSDNLDLVFWIGPLWSISLSILILRKIFIKKDALRNYPSWGILLFSLTACILLLTSSGELLNLKSLKSFLTTEMFLPRNLGYIGRFPHIEITITLLLFWYYRLLRFLEKVSFPNTLLLAFTLAILQYSYFYYWTAALIFTAISTVVYSKSLRSFVVTSSQLIGSYALLTIPFWIQFIGYYAQGAGSEYSLMLGNTIGRQHNFDDYVLKVSLLLFALYTALHFYSKKNFNLKTNLKSFFSDLLPLLILTSTTLICLNIQLVLGYTVEPYHWTRTFFYPMIILVSIDIFKHLDIILRSFQSRWLDTFGKICALSFTMMIIVAALVNNINFGIRWSDYFSLTRSEIDLISYIDQNIPRDSVLFSNNMGLIFILNAHTQTKSFVPEALTTVSPVSEILSRLVIGYKILGYAEGDIRSEIMKGEKWIPEYLHSVRRLSYDPPYRSSTIPDNYLALVYIGHRMYYDQDSRNYTYSGFLDDEIRYLYQHIGHNIESYQLDYLVIYKHFLPSGLDITNLSKPEFENDDFIVLKHIP